MSQKNELKRKRWKNFSEEEKQFLLILIKYFENQIENKKKDSTTCKIKSETWVKITEVYNKYAYQPREPRQLRIFYENTKAKMKKLKTKFVHIFLCDAEKDLLIKILNLFKCRNEYSNFDNIQNDIWKEVHQQFNQLTTTRQVTLLQLYVYYKTHLAVAENGTIDIMPYVTVTIKTEPAENGVQHPVTSTNFTNQESSNETPSISDIEDNKKEDLSRSLQALDSIAQMNKISYNYKNLDFMIRKHQLELEMLQSKIEFSQLEINYKKKYMKLEIEKYKIEMEQKMEMEMK